MLNWSCVHTLPYHVGLNRGPAAPHRRGAMWGSRQVRLRVTALAVSLPLMALVGVMHAQALARSTAQAVRDSGLCKRFHRNIVC